MNNVKQDDNMGLLSYPSQNVQRDILSLNCVESEKFSLTQEIWAFTLVSSTASVSWNQGE